MLLPWRQARREGGGLIERILPHLDAAYNLARWLMRDPIRAEDVVQDAVLRAMVGETGFRGGDPRAWFLRIVRNTAYDALSAARHRGEDLLDETMVDPADDAETVSLHREELALAGDAVAALPLEWREALVLRELEGLSYRDIATVTGAPIGTVMSRLSRARQALLKACPR